MRVENLPSQDQLIMVESLIRWAYRHDTEETFDRSDPRQNRAVALARQLLQDGDISNSDITKFVKDDWSGPVSEA
jgi:hypothetical protein